MNTNEKLTWWREARFGLFIHWGLYSIPAGEWKGRKIDRIAEQIPRFGQIPMAEYEQLTAEFNPVNFDADAVVQLAVDAGMKYLVVTAKHHDGFAMFKSDADPFNIVDAGPFGRDVVKELAEACAKTDVKFCIYYSQRQDWHHPDGSWNEWPNQHPVPFEERDFDFNRCMNDKCIPQMKELLTNYGPLGLVWYDTPVDSTPEQSRKFTELVHGLQPDCFVCDRVGNGFGDYTVLGDNEFPYGSRNLDGEVPATMNHSWGFKRDDSNWKSVHQLLYSLIRSASNGCNYLLNIGPKADGSVPIESVERLKAIGEWMRINGEAIYGVGAAPFLNPFPWGMMTAKGNSLYLVFSAWPGKTFALKGLKSRVLQAVVLAEPDQPVSVSQEDQLVLRNLPPTAPDENFSVIRLDLDGAPQAEQRIYPYDDGSVLLLSANAVTEGTVSVDSKGLPSGFHEDSGSLNWEFEVERPGRYRIEALTNRHWSHEWVSGIYVDVEICCRAGTAESLPAVHGELSRRAAAGRSATIPALQSRELKQDVQLDNIQEKYHPETVSRIGTVELKNAGVHRLSLSITVMPQFKTSDPLCEDLGDNRTINLIQLRLVPEEGKDNL